MKVLLLNLGYQSGLNGSMHDYLVHGARYLHTPAAIAAQVEDSILQLLDAEEPDVCCFLELHKKSALVRDMRGYECSDVDNKYGLKSLLRRLPFFRDNCNGFFSKEEIPYKKFYFHEGAKKLIYELELQGGVSLILCHFSLKKNVRSEQFRELERIIGRGKKVILCGDFNLFGGTNEIAELMTTCDLHAGNLRQATFPSFHPMKEFDQFLCSAGIRVTRCQAMQSFRGSDHLPVILEFQV
jgi:predicted peroxiredoxin